VVSGPSPGRGWTTRCERRVVFNFINVINGDAKLNQALIKDKRNDKLSIFTPLT